jgi:hypothetical protein
MSSAGMPLSQRVPQPRHNSNMTFSRKLMCISLLLASGLFLFALEFKVNAQERKGPSSDNPPLVDGDVLRDLISDNTVTGRHDTGMPYSEWHAPDGRVLGHNNHVMNEEACWDIKGDAVCYYYAGGAARGTFCWTFRKISQNGFRLQSVESGLGAAGLLQKGNPYNFGDNGKPWKCEPLSSHNMTPRDRLKRHAAR